MTEKLFSCNHAASVIKALTQVKKKKKKKREFLKQTAETE